MCYACCDVTLVSLATSLLVTLAARLLRNCTACCDVTLITLTARFTRCSLSSLLCFNIIHCKYATPLIFFNVYCIFFGFRAFYLFFIQILAVILHRNSKSSHVHRTLIALPSHTHTRVVHKRTWCFLQMQVDKELSFILFTPARFIPNPLVPAPRSYLSGGHGGN